jgi:hypothetical protein
MHESTVESLLKAANSSTEGDTSVNLAKRVLLDEAECAAVFESAKTRLLDISEWNRNSSPTEYALFDEAGNQIGSEPISPGQFMRIGLYGAGKYDWVRVVSIMDQPDERVLTVKPTYDPTAEPRDVSTVSHFFGPEATNNFCVQREGKTVAFYVIGLNEHQNTEFTSGLIESVRNSAVANIGYYTGLQKAVWKEFCTNFLKSEEEKG